MQHDVRRTHDRELYLQENRYDRPKEIFKIAAGLARESGVLKQHAKIGDFGCAAGEFLYYFSRTVPEAECFGFDVVPELIRKAGRKSPASPSRKGQF